MNIELKQCTFSQRVDRSQFILEQFKEPLSDVSSFLDVGCYEAPLRKLLPDVSYTGIDIVGDPDIVCNLEQIEKLPFDDNSFESAGCFEVLEHLDAFHLIFNELFRVAQKNVLVSLPNCWCSARRPLERGSGNIAHYGLPQEKPIDRHKWFINTQQIASFFKQYAQNHKNIELKSLIAVENSRPQIARSLRKIRFGTDKYLNRYAHTVIGQFSISE